MNKEIAVMANTKIIFFTLYGWLLVDKIADNHYYIFYMQNRFFSTEFFIILLFFVLPPIVFAQALPAERTMGYSWLTFALAGLAAVLLWQMLHSDVWNRTCLDGNKLWRRLMDQAECLIAFGALVVTAIAFEVLNRFVLNGSTETKLFLPESAAGWVNVILGTICATFYEEVLYRMYLPKAAVTVLSRRKAAKDTVPSKKIIRACEVFTIVLFALAHRYAGWISVANAFIGGAILRRCYRRTNALWTNIVAHAAYNFLMMGVIVQK